MTETERARIRELVATEAEVADLYERMWAQNDRAEKAEAEVERLKAYAAFWRKGIETHPWTKPGDMDTHEAAFKAIYDRGGRESGLATDVGCWSKLNTGGCLHAATWQCLCGCHIARKEARP